MMLRKAALAGALVMMVAACDGPQEQAGEKADNASGAVDGEDSIESGPAETMGERNDEAADSANDAREAQADALEEQADAARDAADQKAEALEQQADNVRAH
ncbi:hypothetical protein [Sphingosinicella sp. BN140058]|uniref:hypothetical protein n=1 Tax=Sphingosinicella sp. BN140058 TaxID=1892855 RepID=UPI0010122CF5|nr:hypothetical protein [Sphingosinicella sp. BN140058]QAY76394.1 hypothetical protein ETR14_07740 [Sphingosinicella sp. BN140058]